MKPVQFRIKMLTLLTIFGLGPVQATPQHDLLDHDTRRLGSEETVDLKETYGGKVVLGFPSNDFGGQEPGTEAQIKNFCRLTYSVRFPMFAKTQVKKGTADPLFQALGEAAGRYRKWNFHKYLVNRDGRLVDNHLSWTSPQSDRIVNAVEELL